jgi:Tfp pilus assembly protein PilO
MKQDSKRLTSYIIAALFIATALIVYFEMILPAYASLQSDKGQATSEQNLYNNEKQVVGQVQTLITNYQNEASTTAAVNMALPVGQDLSGALAQIYGIAANSGISLTSTGINVQNIQTTPASTAATSITTVAKAGGSIVRPAGTVTFQVQGSGSYESFKNFLTELETNIRLFNVTGISIQPVVSQAARNQSGNPDLFNYTITVVTYYQSS